MPKTAAAQLSHGDGYHHGDLRRALIEASLALVREQGPQSLTLREAARRAGVSHTAPYRHFKDKDALIAAVVEEGFVALGRAIERSAPGDGTLRQRLRRSALVYVDFALRRPAHFRVMFARDLSHNGHAAAQRVADQTFDKMIGLVAACQEQGLIRAGDARELARICWATMHGVAQLALSGQFVLKRKRDVQALAGVAIDTVLGGLHPRAHRFDSPARAGKRS